MGIAEWNQRKAEEGAEADARFEQEVREKALISELEKLFLPWIAHITTADKNGNWKLSFWNIPEEQVREIAAKLK